MTIKEIRDLVTRAKLEEALEAAKDHLAVLPISQDYIDQITSLFTQFNQTKRDQRLMMITNERFRMENMRISAGLTDILDSIEEELKEKKDENSSSLFSSDKSVDMSPPPPEDDITSAPPAPAPRPARPAAPPPPDPRLAGGPSMPIATPTATGGKDGITKILFLTANPSDTSRLQLDKEYARVSEKLQEALEPHRYPIRRKRAVTPSEFFQFLFLEQPDIVHFSGHGDLADPEKKTIVEQSRMGRTQPTVAVPKEPEEQESGIFLMDEDRRESQFVSTLFLEHTFQVMVKQQNLPIRAVVFNACHSSAQAEVISKTVPFVVGTSWSVGDQAAIAFSTGFYFGIAQGMDIDKAFDFGIIGALAFNEPKDRFLLYKNGQKVEW